MHAHVHALAHAAHTHARARAHAFSQVQHSQPKLTTRTSWVVDTKPKKKLRRGEAAQLEAEACRRLICSSSIAALVVYQ